MIFLASVVSYFITAVTYLPAAKAALRKLLRDRIERVCTSKHSYLEPNPVSVHAISPQSSHVGTMAMLKVHNDVDS